MDLWQPHIWPKVDLSKYNILNHNKSIITLIIILQFGSEKSFSKAFIIFRTCVLERRKLIGGAAVTEEIVPGYKFSR